MKSIIPTCLILLPFAFVSAQQGVDAPNSARKKAFRDAPSHDQLVKRLQLADKNDPMKSMTSVQGADPFTSTPAPDLLNDSDIICYNGIATLVPKRAILAIPANIKSRLGMQPGARIVGWMEFLSMNRGWVSTVEVDVNQAAGDKKLSDETADRLTKTSSLVVATYQGGPISVLPQKETVDESQKKQTKP